MPQSQNHSGHMSASLEFPLVTFNSLYLKVSSFNIIRNNSALFIICGIFCSFVLGKIALDIELKCVAAVVVISILIAVIHTMASVQSHPVLWRLGFWLFISYILILMFTCLQSVDDIRQFLRYIDTGLGKPQLQQTYAEDCRIYTPANPNGPLANIVDNLDSYVLCHFIGWWIKALIFRDAWLLIISSFFFELMEYTFQYQLPNLEECWWDHWILDFMICNCLGICMGMMMCKCFGLKIYDWWNIPIPKRKLQCEVNSYKIQPSYTRHFIIIVGVMMIILVQEINTFYLEAIFWIPSNHYLTVCRASLYILCGVCAAKEVSEYLQFSDVSAGTCCCALLMITSLIMEMILEIKFGWDIVTLPLPNHIHFAWAVFFSVLLLWTFWYLKHVPYTGLWTHSLIGRSKSKDA